MAGFIYNSSRQTNIFEENLSSCLACELLRILPDNRYPPPFPVLYFLNLLDRRAEKRTCIETG
jgi:hypothetical protein